MRARNLFGKLKLREPSPTTIRSDATATATALADADELERAGRVCDAVDLLADANRARRDPALEIRLLALREAAASAIEPGPGRSPWPPRYPDPFPVVTGALPEITVRELTEEVLGGAVAHHGALLVRELLSPEEPPRIIEGIHRAEAVRKGEPDPEGSAWYRPYPQRYGPRTRARVEQRGNVWMADSPANTAMILDLLAARGITDAIARHLGERPCFSLQKSTLRHLRPTPGFGGWHQDGAFLGPDVRSMNVWVALSPCGGELPTPGLELVPRRFDEILSTDGGVVAHAIAPDLIERVTAETPAVRPEFAPGDGLLFDERFLHSTYLPDHMTDDRYALECWFFAPTHRSPEYVPFLG